MTHHPALTKLVFWVTDIWYLKNKRMKIKAKFKGQDGSLGYRNGENYTLLFTVQDNRRLPYYDHIIIRRIIAWGL